MPCLDKQIASDEQLTLCREFQREIVSSLREFVRQDVELSGIFYCGRPKSRATKEKPARLSVMVRHVDTPGKTGGRNLNCRDHEILVEVKVPDITRGENGTFSVVDDNCIYVRFLIGVGLIGEIIKVPALAFQMDFYRDLCRESIRTVVCCGDVENISATVVRSAQMIMGCLNDFKRYL